jgi:hypothetical protein
MTTTRANFLHEVHRVGVRSLDAQGCALSGVYHWLFRVSSPHDPARIVYCGLSAGGPGSGEGCRLGIRAAHILTETRAFRAASWSGCWSGCGRACSAPLTTGTATSTPPRWHHRRRHQLRGTAELTPGNGGRVVRAQPGPRCHTSDSPSANDLVNTRR